MALDKRRLYIDRNTRYEEGYFKNYTRWFWIKTSLLQITLQFVGIPWIQHNTSHLLNIMMDIWNRDKSMVSGFLASGK